jgi:hypothetical protein
MVDIIDSTYTTRAPPAFASLEELRMYTSSRAKFIGGHNENASSLFVAVKTCLGREPEPEL